MKQFFSRFSRRTWIIVGVVAVILLFVVFANAGGEETPLFQTTPVEQGD
ncbi:MAG: hypothetical protein HC797_07275, partial [Anaerolineales bacterium]|nr:hypothetical protein [Anaerolineales bacterium]